MPHRISQHFRANVVAYLALFLAVGGGGGYALAAVNNKTIHGCVDTHTHALYIQARCHRGQNRVVWNQQGPQGKQGATGRAASAAFAVVDSTGLIPQGQGISVQHLGTGTYLVTITAQGCSTGANVPTVTPTQAISPTQPIPPAGSVPVAWIEDNASNQHFTVHTGLQEGGSFAATDLRFDVQDVCQLSGGAK
jgi:hypothetical protein